MSEKELKKKKAFSPVKIERTHEWPVFSPEVDIVEAKEAFVIKADIPGIEAKNVDVNFEQNILSIHATPSNVDSSCEQIYTEFEPGDYERSFTVSSEINSDKIEAKTTNGVLTLILPKSEHAKPRKIEVKTE